MPVREALVTLANEGLLDVLPRRGFRVARLRQTDIHDVYQIHAFVSGLLAGYAATVISPRQIAELREIDERIGRLERRRLSSVERSERIEELNFKFHRTINLATDHGRLQWYLRTAGQYIPRRFHTRIVGWDETTVHGHTEIINALERHNARRARRLVETHVSIAGDLIIANLDKLGLWSADGPAPEGYCATVNGRARRAVPMHFSMTAACRARCAQDMRARGCSAPARSGKAASHGTSARHHNRLRIPIHHGRRGTH